MKIAFVSQPFDSSTPPIESGSIQIWTYQVARHLVKSCEVTLYAVRKPGESQWQEYESIKYRRISFAVDKWLLRVLRVLKRFSSNPRKPHHASSLYYLSYIIQVALDLRRRDFDIVHVHNFSQFVPIIRALNPRQKIVLHMQGEWLTQLHRPMIKKRLRHVDIVIGCSSYLMNKLVRAIPELAGRTRTVYNGVDPGRFKANGKYDGDRQKERLNLLFVGRHSPEKGVHDLLEAMKKVVEKFPKAHLKIVGPKYTVPHDVIVGMSDDPKVLDLMRFYQKNPYEDGGYLSYLETQRRNGLQENVSFTDSIPHSQLPELYQEADVLVNPSLSETFGISLVEAMASQVPVVATKVGGMVEVVDDGKTGFLTESADQNKLATVLVKLLSDKSLRQQMGKAGRDRVEKYFNWEKIAQQLLEVYKSLWG